MTEHTKRVLEECNSGCKMAIESMKQVISYVKNRGLRQAIQKAQEEHEEIEAQTTKLLEESGYEEKKPGAMASAFSWFSTEMKMTVGDDGQAAKIMMDGCNMGIQSIGECYNQYEGASDEARSIAQHLIKAEEQFVKELEQFL